MKKIMFNDKYGLMGAVLNKRKTMTRRIIKGNFEDVKAYHANGGWHFIADTEDGDSVELKPQYEIGERVAIAQSYEELANSRYCTELGMMDSPSTFKKEFFGKGWGNKMFVKPEHMPHQIRITGISVERLQDISEEDAMREGIFKYDKPPLHHEMDMFAPWPPYLKPYKWDTSNLVYRCNARYAFAYLIDKISGGGTWRSNPWVFVYDFELVK
jgi:hypothetical protein